MVIESAERKGDKTNDIQNPDKVRYSIACKDQNINLNTASDVEQEDDINIEMNESIKSYQNNTIQRKSNMSDDKNLKKAQTNIFIYRYKFL